MSKRTDGNWAEFSQLLLKRDEQRPIGSGWFEFQDISTRMKVSRTSTSHWLNAAIKRGDIERFRGFVHNGRKLVAKSWYRVKKK